MDAHIAKVRILQKHHNKRRNIDLLSIGYPTLRRFTLGPTNPGRIYLALETLGFRRVGFPPTFILLVPAVSLLNAPPVLTDPASAR